MSAVRNIRAKSGASSEKARATATGGDNDTDRVSLAPDEPIEEAPTQSPSPPPGMGRLLDRKI
jgi:hypothetical protein